jgi:hypothetical protein
MSQPYTILVDQGRGPQGPPGPSGPPGEDADGVSHEEFDDHVNSEIPHPVYDDGASFTLLYLNAKV